MGGGMGFDHFIAHVEEWREEIRHQCEVRWLLGMKRAHGREFVTDYLNRPAVAKRRERLRLDLNAAMAAARKARKE